MALSFLSNFCKAKKKREKTRIYEQSRGPGSNTQKKSLALWGKNIMHQCCISHILEELKA
jgi:hypothetical protein